jgi:hypothetical protein
LIQPQVKQPLEKKMFVPLFRLLAMFLDPAMHSIHINTGFPSHLCDEFIVP